jgi:hypothetical protein
MAPGRLGLPGLSAYEPPTKRRGGSGGEIAGLAHSGFRSLRRNRLFQGPERSGSCPERGRPGHQRKKTGSKHYFPKVLLQESADGPPPTGLRPTSRLGSTELAEV